MVDLLWAVPSASLRRSVSAQGRSDRPGGTFGPARLCAPPLRWGHGGTAMPVLLTSLEPLVRALRDDGYRVVGPTVRDGAIVLAELASADDLPYGWGVALAPGGYRLRRRD